MSLDAEVVVVGGGVAGAATAAGLARWGHEVILLDRAAFPREKACGEGLMPHGVSALAALGVLDDVLRTQPGRFTGISWQVGEVAAVGRFPGGRAGLGVRRGRVDAALHAACRRDGVDLREGIRVRHLSGEAGDRVVHTDAGPLRCRAVVAADGLHSPIRRQLGLQAPPRGRVRYGARVHVALRPGTPDRDLVEVFSGEGGELYLTPTGPGEVNVALLLERDAARALGAGREDAFWSLVRAFPPVRERLAGATAVSALRVVGPLRQAATTPVADGVLLVGDAAGFLDAITGEGMSLGLAGAALASRVLSAGLRTNRLRAVDLSAYASGLARSSRDQLWLTGLLLWGIRHRTLAQRVVANLARHPDLFGRILAVNTGEASLRSLGPTGLGRVLLG
jgi:flavin-dependent dehydrogenase